MKTNLIGQENIIKMLSEHIEQNKLANAYLITGQKGIGKKTLAYDFANAILCESHTGKCSCSSCIKFKTKNHPNLYLIKTEEKTIKIDVIRDLMNKIERKPFENNYNVVIIEEAHKMNASSQNALLKSLEEPKNTIFILTADENNLLDTIISRTVIIKPRPLLEEEIEKLLKEKYTNEEKINFAKKYCIGNLKIAYDIMENEGFMEFRKEILQNFFNIDKDLNIPFKIAKKYEKEDITKINEMINILKFAVKDCYMFSKLKNEHFILNRDFIEEIKNIKINEPLKKLDYLESMSNYLKYNLNKKIFLQELFLNFQN